MQRERKGDLAKNWEHSKYTRKGTVFLMHVVHNMFIIIFPVLWFVFDHVGFAVSLSFF